MPINSNVLRSIESERNRQDAKWGQQSHEAAIWLAILTEEVGEVAQEVLRRKFERTFWEDLPTELTHVAAVAIQWLEAIEREENEP